MRKILILIGIVAALAGSVCIFWVFNARSVSVVVDRYWTVETSSGSIRSLHYEGTGQSGVLVLNDLRFNLAPVDSTTTAPDVGTTKDNQLALSFAGNVFAFGPVAPNADS